MAMNLSCNFVSLKEICLRRIAVIVSNNFASIHFTSRQLGSIFKRQSLKVDLRRDDYIVRKLELPPVLTEQVKNLIQPICIQIENWKLFLKSYFIKSYETENFDGPSWTISLSQVCWTNLGTIDHRKTAEKLIHLEQIDIVERYKLACLYCLEDYIPIFWEQLPENSKIYFCESDRRRGIVGAPLEFCWAKILKGEENALNDSYHSLFQFATNFNQFAFKDSACYGNKTAAEFFLRKLNDGEREESVLKTIQEIQRIDLYSFEYYYVSEILFYLLFLLNPEQRMAALNREPYKVLKCLISWPWQDLFLQIADCIWDLLSAVDFYNLLQKISDRMESCHILKKLFQAFFLRGSSDFRKHFIVKECEHMHCFSLLFVLKDSETIEVIFRNIDAADRKRLGNCKYVQDLFLRAFETGREHLVELFIKEAMLSNEDKTKLKEAIYAGNGTVYLISYYSLSSRIKLSRILKEL